jgi:hypothetical protein
LALSACQCCIPTALAVPGPLRLTFAPKQKRKLLLILAVVLLAVEGLRYGILKKKLIQLIFKRMSPSIIVVIPKYAGHSFERAGLEALLSMPP